MIWGQHEMTEQCANFVGNNCLTWEELKTF